MNVELNQQEAVILRELLRSRMAEMHPEIRRCRDYEYRDALKAELALVEGLFEKLPEPAEAE